MGWRAGVVASALLVTAVLIGDHPWVTSSVAQETPSTGAPAPDIIPRPNSGTSPDDAGDRGGALQLVVLGAVVLGIGGAAAHLVRQARRSADREP